MVKLGQSDERIFGELRDALQRFLGLLSPVTERFAPLDVILRKLLASKLGSGSVAVKVAVMGRRKSGKSSVVNALMGQDVLPRRTLDPLVIHPSKEDPVALRTNRGKTIAVTPEGVKRHLVDERVPTNRTRPLVSRSTPIAPTPEIPVARRSARWTPARRSS